jgi:hypothetical protein
MTDLATHFCKSCLAEWAKHEAGTWSLVSPKCGECCDNVPMANLQGNVGWKETPLYKLPEAP